MKHKIGKDVFVVSNKHAIEVIGPIISMNGESLEM